MRKLVRVSQVESDRDCANNFLSDRDRTHQTLLHTQIIPIQFMACSILSGKITMEFLYARFSDVMVIMSQY